MYNFDSNTSKWEPLYEAARLLDEATARDPDFFDAWYLLTDVQGSLLFYNADPTPTARMALAEAALANVRRLRPDAGETHLAAATYFYHIRLSDKARPELDLARRLMPNNWNVLYTTALTSKVAGRWGDALAAIQEARVLNPRYLGTLIQVSIIYGALRRYEEAERVAEDASAAGIGVDYFTMRHATLVHNQTGDTSEYHAVFRRLAGQGQPTERTLLIRYDIASA